MWARCRQCKRQVELKERKPTKTNDALVGDAGQICDAAWADLDSTEMIIDSGCRRSVAGRAWHGRFQQTLSANGLRGVKRDTADTFRYGDGQVVRGT